MVLEIKEKHNYLPVQARNKPKTPTSVLVQSSWQLHMTKSGKMFYSLVPKSSEAYFMSRKNGQKKCKAKPVCIPFYTNTDRDDN